MTNLEFDINRSITTKIFLVYIYIYIYIYIYVYVCIYIYKMRHTSLSSHVLISFVYDNESIPKKFPL